MKDEERDKKIQEFIEEARREVEWCFIYTAKILVDMELYKIKQVDFHWV